MNKKKEIQFVRIGKSIAHKTTTVAVLCLMLLIVLICGGWRQNEAYQIMITVPSDESGPVTPGHSFFINGVIERERIIPEDATLRVSILDEKGTELRFAESTRKNEDRIERFCDAFFYYADDTDPERSTVHASVFPFLIVDGSEHSLQNANIKCWFSDDSFSAFIPYATDAAHGLLMDDGIGYTDAEGNVYDALPDGKYTAVAVLKDGNGSTLASTEKEFSIRPAQNAILCRFHPDEHYERMMQFAEENDLSMNIDYLPGYYRDPNGNDRGGLRAMFIGGDCALYNGSHVVMFNYLASPSSSSLTFDLPFIEKYYNVDDPERFTVYYYDIGEPVLQVGKDTVDGKIVKAEANDKLCLCRADLAANAEEGHLDYNTAQIRATDTDFSDGISLQSQEDCELAIAGVIIPHQLKEEEILFDPANNETGLLNRVETIIYSVRDAAGTKQYQKPVSMIRVFKDGSEYDSVLEFYHVFSRDEIDPDGTYEVSLYGIDKNGNRIEGTSESFVVNSK